MRLRSKITEQLSTIVYESVSVSVENQKGVVRACCRPGNMVENSVSTQVKCDAVRGIRKIKTIAKYIDQYWAVARGWQRRIEALFVSASSVTAVAAFISPATRDARSLAYDRIRCHFFRFLAFARQARLPLANVLGPLSVPTARNSRLLNRRHVERRPAFSGAKEVRLAGHTISRGQLVFTKTIQIAYRPCLPLGGNVSQYRILATDGAAAIAIVQALNGRGFINHKHEGRKDQKEQRIPCCHLISSEERPFLARATSCSSRLAFSTIEIIADLFSAASIARTSVSVIGAFGFSGP